MQKRIVAVGSKNPVKLAAVKEAFTACFGDDLWVVEGVVVESGVADQPMSDGGGIRGAGNRARRALTKITRAEFGVGLEGSLQKIDKEWFDCGWVVVVDKGGEMGLGSTARILMPKKAMNLIRKGYEAGAAFDLLTGRKNTKQQEGMFGILTKGVVSRKQGYREGVIMALTRFLSSELYEET